MVGTFLSLGHLPLFRLRNILGGNTDSNLIATGVAVRVCGTCQGRCGIAKGESYYQGANKSSMMELSDWVRTSDHILTF